MKPRYSQTGGNNWQARSGYRRMSDQNARLVRPKGEMSWLEGSLFVAAAFVLLAIGAAVLPDETPAATSGAANAPAHGSAVVEVDGPQDMKP